jgi:ubiquitin carboxyl-terminal hydrolase 34
MFFRRKRFQSPTTFNFNIDNLCQPGQTLLWDLIQDDKIVQLSDGLAIESQKALTNLLCFGSDKHIRLKFIEGCINNIVENQAVVVSLRLLPKLLTSFNQLRLPGDIHQVTMWAEREHLMLEKFFRNLYEFKMTDLSPSPFPYHVHVQVRLDFLSAVFSTMGSPEDFR